MYEYCTLSWPLNIEEDVLCVMDDKESFYVG